MATWHMMALAAEETAWLPLQALKASHFKPGHVTTWEIVPPQSHWGATPYAWMPNPFAKWCTNTALLSLSNKVVLFVHLRTYLQNTLLTDRLYAMEPKTP
jgi:hypothetical protein